MSFIKKMSSIFTIENIKQYFWNNLISFDQGVNTIFFGLPDETISSRMGKLVEQDRCPFCYWICRHILHRIDPNHCQKSIERDEN